MEGVAGVLASPVGVVDQSSRRFPAEPRHCQRVHIMQPIGENDHAKTGYSQSDAASGRMAS